MAIQAALPYLVPGLMTMLSGFLKKNPDQYTYPNMEANLALEAEALRASRNLLPTLNPQGTNRAYAANLQGLMDRAATREYDKAGSARRERFARSGLTRSSFDRESSRIFDARRADVFTGNVLKSQKAGSDLAASMTTQKLNVLRTLLGARGAGERVGQTQLGLNQQAKQETAALRGMLGKAAGGFATGAALSQAGRLGDTNPWVAGLSGMFAPGVLPHLAGPASSGGGGSAPASSAGVRAASPQAPAPQSGGWNAALYNNIANWWRTYGGQQNAAMDYWSRFVPTT